MSYGVDSLLSENGKLSRFLIFSGFLTSSIAKGRENNSRKKTAGYKKAGKILLTELRHDEQQGKSSGKSGKTKAFH